ncbi:hypothetical protein [Microbacterium atlanticum]|uniref:hypothetical protein n=1 Tax=Microbacterium atlanticum TaxID=2782168 RepID=UPI0018886215|nr:hypothetical protein [Microbacterium atlanticum]
MLTAELCDAAFELVRPAIEQHFAADGLFESPFGELVVLDPTREYSAEYAGGAEDPLFKRDVVLWSRSFGDRAAWEFEYDVVARSKAYISFKYRLPSQTVVRDLPYLLEPGMTKYGGGSIDESGRLVVACAGAEQSHLDVYVCDLMLAAIRALTLSAQHEVDAQDDVHTMP